MVIMYVSHALGALAGSICADLHFGMVDEQQLLRSEVLQPPFHLQLITGCMWASVAMMHAENQPSNPAGWNVYHFGKKSHVYYAHNRGGKHSKRTNEDLDTRSIRRTWYTYSPRRMMPRPIPPGQIPSPRGSNDDLGPSYSAQ
eukprot:351855-Chlamydomonas_euryale.AAC.5